MSRIVRALQHLLPLSLGCVTGLAATSLLGSTLHAAGVPPTISIIAPGNGSTVSGTVSVWGAASDAGLAGVTFTVNGVALGSEITGGACLASWNTTGAPEGNYSVSAVARDGAGNLTYATPVTVGVINSAPQISGVTAWNINGSTASITWNTNQVTDGSVDSGYSASYGTTASASIMATTHTIVLSGLAGGTTYHYRVNAWNVLGSTSATSDLIFTTTGGTTPPPSGPPPPTPPQIFGVTVSNISPTSVSVVWSTDQATTSSVDFGTSTNYGSLAADLALSTSHSVVLSNLTTGTTYHSRVQASTAQALSNATSDFTFTTSGGSTPPPPTVPGAPTPPTSPAPPSSSPAPAPAPGGAPAPAPVNNIKPFVTLTSPLQSEAFGLPAKVMISANAGDSDGAVTSVAFYVNGALMGTVASAPYTLSWVTWTTGNYTVLAVAVDNRGAATASTPVVFRVENRANSLHSACPASDPFLAIGGGGCMSGVWVPPGFSFSANGTGTVKPIFDNETAGGGCTTPDPYEALGGGTCIGGGWLPPGLPTGPKGMSEGGGCMTPDPFVNVKGLIGVCINQNWVPAIKGIGG